MAGYPRCVGLLCVLISQSLQDLFQLRVRRICSFAVVVFVDGRPKVSSASGNGRFDLRKCKLALICHDFSFTYCRKMIELRPK